LRNEAKSLSVCAEELKTKQQLAIDYITRITLKYRKVK
jgi:hypothetical protein